MLEAISTTVKITLEEPPLLLLYVQFYELLLLRIFPANSDSKVSAQ